MNNAVRSKVSQKLALKPASETIFASKPKILPNSVLRSMKLGSINSFHARYANVKAYPQSTGSLMLQDNARWPMLAKRFEQRMDPLWWSATTTKEVAPNRTVRSWICRRVKQAMVESLRKRGWDSNGRPIEGGGRESSLYGTLQFKPLAASIQCTVSRLLEETDMVVSQIVEAQEASRSNKTLPALRKQKSFTSSNFKGSRRGERNINT